MLRLLRLLLFLSTISARTHILDKHRRASDAINDLISRSGIEDDPESQQFRQMIAAQKSTNPLKLLHYLAPKIPAIRHSPDVALRIRASRSDMDCGLAACVIATLGRACELQDEQQHVDDILKDRRFEQLVECVMCGVDHKQEEYTEGLSIRDACRAAWGIAVLMAHRKKENLGEEVLQALSLRVAHVLAHRQDLLKTGDMIQDSVETIHEGIELFSEELAEDAATVLWTFACVKVCTGQNVTSLVNLCTSILVQDPFAVRKIAQEESFVTDANLEIGANDAVERLAQSEVESSDIETENTDVLATDLLGAATVKTLAMPEKSRVLDWLSPNELIDSLWAIALHGAKLDNASNDIDIFCDIALRRLAEFLQTELQHLQAQSENEEQVQVHINSGDVSRDSGDVDLDNGNSETGYFIDEHQNLDDNQVRECSEADFSEVLMNVNETRDSHVENEDAASEFLQESIDGLNCRLSPHDLCSLAWAVTELDGSHREVILHDISSIFKCLGVNSVRELSGPDLSNICWAIAKSNFAIQDDVSDIVVKWIADREMEITSEDDGLNGSDSLLRHLNPHELSRLVWSLSTILLDQGSVRWTSVSIVSLTYRSLITASLHIDIFSSEDMARVIWGFLSLTDTSVSFGWPGVPQALGKLLATIETSLLEWENVRESNPVDTDINYRREASKVSTFLGRSRFALRFLDQRIENAWDGLQDAPELTKKTNRLPLLRDIPVDPLSLCKLSLSVCKLAHQFDKTFIQSGVLTRIPLRLFASHDGRLLRECPLSDLARLAEAAALSLEVPATRELIGHFTRKVLHMINRMPSDESGFIWLDLGPDDLSGLLWSLGKLGATYCKTDPDRLTAHRRLHLTVKPHFPLQSLESFSISKTIRMLNGLVSTQLALQMTDQVTQVLLHLERKVSVTEEELNASALLETLATLRRAIVEESSVTRIDSEDQSGNITKSLDEQEADPEGSVPYVSVTQENLLEICDRVLISFAVSIADRLPTISTRDIHEILSVLIHTPLQSDALVTAIEACIQDRAKTIDTDRRAPNTISSASNALRSLRQVLSSQYNDPLSISLVDNMPSLLEMENLDTVIAALDDLHNTIAYTHPRVSRKPSLDAMELEFSWCRELIEQYNRLDFSSGSFRNCLDQQRRRKLAKRALSRLLPGPSRILPFSIEAPGEGESSC